MPTRNRFIVTLLIMFLSFFFEECGETILTLKLRPSIPKLPGGTLLVGAAKVEITPPPGCPMGGNSLEAKTATGFWTRLYSRAIYIEDSMGTPLVLVATELWGVSSGFCNRVVELVQDSIPTVGRENVIIAATHTHQSPGNFASWSYYNIFAQNLPGFNQDLFEFLAHRVAQSIIGAYKSSRPADIKYQATRLHRVVRNRSYLAFQKDIDNDELVSTNDDIPIQEVTKLFPYGEAYRAIDPSMRLVTFLDRKDNSIIADAIFFAMHPNSLGSYPEYYNGGVFGAASQILESKWANGGTPIAAIFNGAEGDVSPLFEKQGPMVTKKLAGIIADSVLSLRNGTHEILNSPRITSRFLDVKLRDTVAQFGNDVLRTAKVPMPGDPVSAGAEDGRGPACGVLFCEGDTNLIGPSEQKPKSLYQAIGISLLKEDFFRNSLPERVPIGIYELGGLTLCTLPGEFTTMLGHRIRKSVANRMSKSSEPILIGLANEYVSYMTTKEEYGFQHYEGASTLYGNESGRLMVLDFGELSTQTSGLKYSGSFTYRPGFMVDYGIAEKMDAISKKLMLPAKVQSTKDCYCKNDPEDEQGKPIEYPWSDALPSFSPEKAQNPSVSVESSLVGANDWKTFETEENLNMVITMTGKTWTQFGSKWKVNWYAPQLDPRMQYRFVIKKIDGTAELAPIIKR